MDIAVSQGMEGLKFFNLVNLEMDIGIAKDRRTGSTVNVDDLIVIFFHSVKFYPDNMMFHPTGMRKVTAHNDSNDVMPFYISLIYCDSRDMFFFSLIIFFFMISEKSILSRFHK